MTDLRISSPYLWTLSTIWPTVCAVVVAARFATRKYLRSRMGWDDWLTLPALVLVFGMGVMIIVGTAQGALGKPTPKPPPGVDKSMSTSPEETLTRKLYWSLTAIQLVTLTFIKISCMLFYRRIFCRIGNRNLRWLINGINTILVIWGVSFLFAWTFGCASHFRYPFGSLNDSLKCNVDYVKVNLAVSISDTILDLVVFAFPIPLILKTKLSTFRKIALLVIFSLGAAAIAASIVRLAVIILILGAQFEANGDLNFGSTAGIYFMFAEACFGLCAISLPTLAGASEVPIVRRLLSCFHDSSARPSASTQSPNNTLRQSERSRKSDHSPTSANRPKGGEMTVAGIVTK